MELIKLFCCFFVVFNHTLLLLFERFYQEFNVVQLVASMAYLLKSLCKLQSVCTRKDHFVCFALSSSFKDTTITSSCDCFDLSHVNIARKSNRKQHHLSELTMNLLN